MSSGTSLEAALQVLEDNSISYLMRSENYRNVENAISNGGPVSPQHTKQLLQVFAHDLKQDTKFAVTILKLLSVVLKKVKLGEYESYPELSTTATAIMNILSKMAPLYKVQSLQNLCLEVLLSYPDRLYLDLGTKHTPDIVNLMDQYLSNTNVDSEIKVMMMNIVVKVLESLAEDEKKVFVEKGLSVWFSRLVPLIFSGLPLKEKALNITESIISDIIRIDYSDHPQWNVLFKNISSVDKYPEALKKMLADGDPLWHRAWCCIVKLLGSKLHKSAALINSLLSVLENAFKMNMADRCRAFQCWKILIENFSLNMDQFFTSRRIKLLLIPLTVNNAKEENSASAKFETWWFLLGLLQPKIEHYVDTIVVQFLQFCFGQAKPTKDKLKPVVVPGLAFSKVRNLAIQAIVEVVGHSDCSGCIPIDIVKLPAPILSPKTLVTHFESWMHAIKEATILISEIKHDQTEQTIACLYKSLLKYISAIDDEANQAKVYGEFVKMISELVLKSQQNPSLANIFFNMITPSILNEKSGLLQLDIKHKSGSDVTLQHFFKLLLCPAFEQFNSPCTDTSIKMLKPLTDLALQCDGFAKWLLQELQTGEHTITWWTSLTKSIVDTDCRVNEDVAKDILIWPITKLEYITNVRLAAQSWSETYTFINQSLPKDSPLHLDVLNILMLHYKNTYVHNVFTIHILPLTITYVLENDSNKVDSMEKEFEVLSHLSAMLGELCDDDYKTILEATIECLNSCLYALAKKCNAEAAMHTLITVFNNVFKCVLTCQTINQIDTEKLIQKILKSAKVLFPNGFDSTFLLMENSLSKCGQTMIPDFRKICNEWQNSKSDVKANDITEVSNIKDKEIKTSKSKTPSKAKVTSKIVNKVVDGNEEFVIIKSNWKFNPNKLTEHQKEVLKKKREDIPALYQDLSQSQDEVRIKSWKMPDYKSDSQDVSTSTTISLDKNDADNSVSNILKDIPNCEVCPNVMKAIMKEDNKQNDKIQTPKVIPETLKENSALKVAKPVTPKVLQKIIPSKSRMSLKDKVSKSVQSLLGNVIPSDITSPVNKSLNPQTQYTPKNTNDCLVSTALSAPPKLDSERPSRTKRKPKKLEDDFEILDVIKRKRHSTENEAKSCDYRIKLKENDDLQTSQESEKVKVIAESQNVKEIINSNKNLEEIKKCSDPAIEEIITIHDESNPLPEHQMVEKMQPTDNPVTEIVTISHSPEQEQITTANISEITSKCTPKPKTYQNPENKLIAQNTETEQITSTNPSENTPKYIPKPKSKQDPEAKLLPTKKKNRLEVLLAIDTVEGHPLLTSKEEVRSTRKSRANELQTKRNNVDKTRISLGDTPKVKDSKKIKLITSVSDKSDTIIGTASDSQNSYASGDTSNNNASLVNEAKPLQTSSRVFDNAELPLSMDFIESSQDSPVSSITIKSSRRSSNKHHDKKLQKTKITDSSSTSECESDPGSTDNILNTAKKPNELLIDSGSVDDGALAENTNAKIHRYSTVRDCTNAITIDNLGDETIATMDTQPLETCTMTETVIDEEGGKTISEIGHVNIASQETNKVKNLSDEEIAEMDTEPFAPMTHVSSREITYSDDIIVIDDNSCDNTVVPPINLDSDSTTVAVADSENAQQLPPSEIGTSELVKCDSPKHTEIINMCENSGKTDESTISAPRSPFDDNKERDHEFLNNTYDISPIKVSSPQERDSSPPASDDNSNDFVVITLTSPVKGDDEPLNKCESPEMFTNDKVSPDKKDESPTRTNTSGSTGSPSSSLSLKKNRAQMRPSGRGAQMLGLCNPSNFYQNCNKVNDSTETNGTSVVTPAAKRNLRVAYANCLDNESHPAEDINHDENFLNLIKELPPVTSSPAGPILKRKLADIADETTMSPVSKRKRVSFHDPPVSTTVSVHKYIEDTCMKSPQQYKNTDRRSRPMTSRKKLENAYADSIIQAMDTSIANNKDTNETTTENTQRNSLTETPVAVIVATDEVTNSDPIYPELTDCTHPIANIISELTTDSMKDIFLKDLRDIATIGDLAKLTELEVNRLSIKTPKVQTARNVLASYACKAKDEPTPKTIEVSHMEIQTEFEEEFLWETLKDRTSREVIESCLEKKDDFIVEFSNVVSTEIKRKMAEDLPTSVIGALLNDRFKTSNESEAKSKESEQVLTTLVRDNPQKFLDKTFSEVGADQFSERLGLDNMQKYILQKLSFVELAKFVTILLQKKLPSD